MSTHTNFYAAGSSLSTGCTSLSRDDELELAMRWRKSGDASAAKTLIQAHLGLVISVARKYSRYPVPRDELIAEGNLGIVRALQRFEPERGLRFATYAVHWVRSQILNYVIKSWSLVGGGGPLRSQLFFKLRRERSLAANALGEGEAADALAAERLGVSTSQFKAMAERLDARDLPLDAPAPGQPSLMDALASTDDQEVLLSDVLDTRSVASTVQGALGALDARERYIAEHRWLADQSEELSLSEIGRRLGISRERVRQLEARAKRKLRKRLSLGGDAMFHEWLGHFVQGAKNNCRSAA